MTVRYGLEPAQVMDVHVAPSQGEKAKVLILLHGGSWSGGDKAEFAQAIPILRQQLNNFAIFNINYRLANRSIPSTQYPAQINDLETAIGFIVSKAETYHVDTRSMALLGVSAGAHLALLQAYKNNSNGHIKAVIDLFGPTDLHTLFTRHPFGTAPQPTLQNFLNASPVSNPRLYYDASPVNFVSAQSPPTQIFHGANDVVVPVAQSIALKNRLQQMQVKVETTVYPNEGHGWLGASLFDTYTKAVTFLKQNVP